MKLYVDLETLQLIEGPGFRNPVTSLRFKRGDAALLEVAFLANGTTPAHIGDPAALELQFGIKPRGRYDVGFLVHEADWTMPAAGAETPSYLCSPSFNTVELDSALQVGSATGAELPEVTLMGEITWREGAGQPTSTRTFFVVVENDVNRGTEGVPTEAEAPYPAPESLLTAQTIGEHAVRHDVAQNLSPAARTLVIANIGLAAVAAGAPVNAVAASGLTTLGGGNNDLVWQWGEKGSAGNGKQVEYVHIPAPGQVLAVQHYPDAPQIVVLLATDGAGTVTTTAQDILDWLAAHPEFTAATARAPLGAAVDGIVAAHAPLPLACGLDGTLAAVPTIHDDGAALWFAQSNTASQDNWRPIYYGSNSVEETGTEVTLTNAHHARIIRLTNPGAVTLTIPAGLFPDFNCAVLGEGVGGFTITVASGVTRLPGIDLVGLQGEMLTLFAVAANVYRIPQ